MIHNPADDVVFLVMASAYDENSGGNMVSHYLVDQLNKYSNAFLVPLMENHLANVSNAKHIQKLLAINVEQYKGFMTNPDWNTPWLSYQDASRLVLESNCVIVYPEIIRGNPLGAKHVARWCLHRPGFFSDDFCFGKSEVLFKYDDWIELPSSYNGFFEYGGTLYCNFPPYDLFGRSPLKDVYQEVAGRDICYAIRKGDVDFEPIFGITHESINIDNFTRREVADIFSKCKRFISFDHNTFYSSLAVLSGCESIVVMPPSKIKSKDLCSGNKLNWLAYDVEDLPRAISHSSEALEYFDGLIGRTEKSVLDFINFWRIRI
jgi:hypothetical protein